MPKSSFVDFRAIKAVLTMEQILQHYGLLDRFKKSGDSLSGPCPIHKGTNPTQFRVSLTKSVWNCFSECKHGGNTLDFITRMENISIHAAALKAVEWFGLDPEAMSADSDEEPEPTTSAPQPRPALKPAPAQESTAPNPPLKFRLDKLERNHPYLAERGLTPETVEEFGVGFCAKGMMKDRIAIPICNPESQVVAYAGRTIAAPDDNNPKYKLPPGFKKSLELFNIETAIKEPKEMPLIIVEGFFDAMKLHQNGCRKVVALMGSSLSLAQEGLLRKHTDRNSHIIVMLDEDEAGRATREEISARLARFAFVRIHAFEKEGMQPEHLTAEQLRQIVGGVS